jgi:hypothetical protein
MLIKEIGLQLLAAALLPFLNIRLDNRCIPTF